VKADTLAVYLNDQIEIGKHWKIVGGVRWDRFDAEVDQHVYVPSFTPSLTGQVPYSVDQTVNMFSVRAGLIWQPTEEQSYYISYGTSANPSAEGLTLTAAQAGTDPEKNRAFEIGAKFDLFDGELQLSSALFQIEKTDARTTANNVVTLDGDQRVRGLELSAVGHLTPQWQVLAGYTYMDSEIEQSLDATTVAVAGATLAAATTNVTLFAEGNRLQNTPRDTASVWTTYNITDRWEMGGGAVYSSKRYVNNFETAVIDGYTSLNATIAYRQKEFGVRLNLQNLTDEVYYETASGGRATPAVGRTAVLTTSYWF
jgi:catecholate siderophore receptor